MIQTYPEANRAASVEAQSKVISMLDLSEVCVHRTVLKQELFQCYPQSVQKSFLKHRREMKLVANQDPRSISSCLAGLELCTSESFIREDICCRELLQEQGWNMETGQQSKRSSGNAADWQMDIYIS